MTAFWNKKKDQTPTPNVEIVWDETARQSIDQAVNGAPVPGLLKGKIKKELMSAAEEHAQQDDRTNVTAEDVVAGMLAKMPAAMRDKVTAAIHQGPDALKNLERELRDQK